MSTVTLAFTSGAPTIAPVETTVTLDSFDGALSAADTAAQIATHNALSTGVHGVGASTVASTADITTHNASATAHGLTANIYAGLGAMQNPSATNYPLTLDDLFLARLHVKRTNTNITLQYGAATYNFIWTRKIGNYWLRWTLLKNATNTYSFNNISLCEVIDGYAYNSGSITRSGSWSSGTTGFAFSGGYYRSNITGNYEEAVITGVSELYVMYSKLSNGGFGNVTINGATTLINEMTIVGGKAQIDCYDAVGIYNNRQLVASGLDPATSYTLRVTVDGTKDPASSDYRVYIEGLGGGAMTINANVHANVNSSKVYRDLGAAGSVYEYAYQYKPTGATLYQWTGGSHGNEAISAITWRDGSNNDITVSVGTPLQTVSSIVVTQTITSRHGQTGTTDHANVTLRHTFNDAGCTVYHLHTFLTACDMDTAYAAMLPGDDTYTNHGHVDQDGATIYDLSGNDDVAYGKKTERLAAVWHASFPYIAWIFIPDLADVLNYAYSIRNLWIEDRSASYNKIYFEMVGGTADQVNYTASIGSTLECTAEYHVKEFTTPDGCV